LLTLGQQAMADSAARCSHCGKVAKKNGLPLHCSVCNHASYCGALCQSAGWQLHKKTCVTLHDVRQRVSAAHEADDWRGVLKWEGRMDELMDGLKDAWCDWSLHAFSRAHELGYRSTGNEDHALSIIRLEERRVELLGKLGRFRDQGAALRAIANHLNRLGRTQESATCFQRARDLGAQHGFFPEECGQAGGWPE